MKISSGILTMTIRYAYQRGNSIYYQRAIPGDLQARYGAKTIKVKLDAQNVFEAAGEIKKLNQKTEAEWAAMRGGVTSQTPRSTRERAHGFLGAFGIDPVRPDPMAVALLYDSLDEKRIAFAEGDEIAYREASPDEYLAPHEMAAAQMLAGSLTETLSDALKLYLDHHKKRDDPKFRKTTEYLFSKMVSVLGDKPVKDINRTDAHMLVSKLQEQKLSTGSIRRVLNTNRAILNNYFTEREIDRKNPLADLPIPGEGDDKNEREPFTHDELVKLADLIQDADDPDRWLLGLLMDTGLRLAEAVGLEMADIKLDALVPHVVIQSHPWRSLKTAESKRNVPLVGMALWAANRICKSAVPGQRFAFPKLTTETHANAAVPSAVIAKWLRAKGLDHTAHELRHTLADRLRDVQCPEDVRLAIGGWSSTGVGNKYGTGYGLGVKAGWLEKIVLPK
ncbi:tyrosine-type recombinase/integrase [Pseudoduganella lutea]|uniref:Recombinase n=1 Tax=Pseudoduganella lutea TaxID=321985 RepID=A0A4P6L641_9BURK|nr:tyrosine-type recombinase/integrase [Pseudoduganella lutea]QBE66825.1 recombinase [Pseudoduganella lutea]